MTQQQAIDEIVAASLRAVVPYRGGSVEALAGLGVAVTECFEAALWLAASGFPEDRAHDGPPNEWDRLGEVIVLVGAAALRLAHATQPGQHADPAADGSETVRRAMSERSARSEEEDWRAEPTRALAAARWSGLLRRQIGDAMAHFARLDLERTHEQLMQTVGTCVEAVAWLSPRTVGAEAAHLYRRR